MIPRNVFVTGGSGYLGRAVIPELLRRGHEIRALARPASVRRIPPGAAVIAGNALDVRTFAESVAPSDTFLHLVGTPHPSPAKAQQFRDVDLVSAQAAVAAARHAWIRHFVYLSVAYPAPIMHAYIDVRKEGEALIRSTGMPATFLRPFYVLGPGHWWPYPLLPVFRFLRSFPGTRESANRLQPVTIGQMVAALVFAVENPPKDGVREMNAPQIIRRA